MILADELSEVADMINWPRMLELKEFESGYYGTDELMDTSAAEGAQLCEISGDIRPGWAPVMRKMLDPKAPPAETGRFQAN